jgi:hypothetical protein
LISWLRGISEIRRLTAENKKLGGRVAFLEEERERLINENREHSLAWADRFITKHGQFATGDEIKGKVVAQSGEAQRLRDLRMQEDLQAHLDSVRARLRQDAIDAGLDASHAEAMYAANKAAYEQQFYDGLTPFL